MAVSIVSPTNDEFLEARLQAKLDTPAEHRNVVEARCTLSFHDCLNNPGSMDKRDKLMTQLRYLGSLS